MKRSLALIIFVLTVIVLKIPMVDSESSLRIVSVTSATSAPCDEPLKVDITVAHDANLVPIVTVYYTYLLNQTPVGWRISSAQITSIGPMVSVYTAAVPNPAYHEYLPLNAEIVFYVEAKDELGNMALTCNISERWNAKALEGKYTFILIDPYRPVIHNVSRVILNPTSSDLVEIDVNASDRGAGVDRVFLLYSIDGGVSWNSNRMVSFTENLYSTRVPAQRKDTKVLYYIEAYDKAGNLATSLLNEYQVMPSYGELTQETWQRLMLLALPIVGATVVILIALELALRRRTREPSFEKPSIGECKHPNAMTLSFLGMSIAIGALSLQVLEFYTLLALALIFMVVAFWILADPRLNFLIPVARIRKVRVFDENPAAIFIAAGYMLLPVGVLGLLAKFLVDTRILGVWEYPVYYSLAITIAEYVLGLLGVGILLQIAWPRLKEMEISVELIPAEQASEKKKERE